MGMPYSNDLRLRVSGHGGWRAGAAGCHAVAGQRFVHLQVSHPSLEDGRDSGADAVCTRPPRKLAGHEQAVLTRLGAITTGGGPNEGRTRRPQRSILIRSPVALCSQCHGAQAAAPGALRMRCSWLHSEARNAAGRLRIAATAFRPTAVCAM